MPPPITVVGAPPAAVDAVRFDIERADGLTKATLYANLDPFDTSVPGLFRGGIYCLEPETPASMLDGLADLVAGTSYYRLGGALVTTPLPVKENITPTLEALIAAPAEPGRLWKHDFGAGTHAFVELVASDDVSLLIIRTSAPNPGALAGTLESHIEQMNAIAGRLEADRDVLATEIAARLGMTPAQTTSRLVDGKPASVARAQTRLRSNVLEYPRLSDADAQEPSQCVLFYYGVSSLVSARFNVSTQYESLLWVPEDLMRHSYVVTHVREQRSAEVKRLDGTTHLQGVPEQARASIEAASLANKLDAYKKQRGGIRRKLQTPEASARSSAVAAFVGVGAGMRNFDVEGTRAGKMLEFEPRKPEQLQSYLHDLSPTLVSDDTSIKAGVSWLTLFGAVDVRDESIETRLKLARLYDHDTILIAPTHADFARLVSAYVALRRRAKFAPRFDAVFVETCTCTLVARDKPVQVRSDFVELLLATFESEAALEAAIARADQAAKVDF